MLSISPVAEFSPAISCFNEAHSSFPKEVSLVENSLNSYMFKTFSVTFIFKECLT